MYPEYSQVQMTVFGPGFGESVVVHLGSRNWTLIDSCLNDEKNYRTCPANYPEFGPEMFYLFPWVRISSSDCYPYAADQQLNIGGRVWQRW